MSKNDIFGWPIGSLGAEKINFRKVNNCQNSYYSIGRVSRDSKIAKAKSPFLTKINPEPKYFKRP